MSVSRIVLVIPQSERVRILRTGYNPPLGLLSIGANIRQTLKSAYVAVVNGETYETEQDCLSEILSHNPDIVGITTNVGCYKTALSLAKKLRQHRGNTIQIVLGGPYASVMWHECLTNRPYIDHCVVGDGEIPMTKLTENIFPEKIAGCATRNRSGGIVLIPPIDEPLDNYSDPDWSLINPTPYQEAYRHVYGLSDATFACINAMKGCLWQEKTGGCIFCGLLRTKLRQRSPKRVWQEINRLYEQYGCNHFWELSDTIGCDKEWLRRLASLKPNRQISFRGYLRATETTHETVQLLKDIGYEEVFIGIESGDNKILRLSNKGCTTSQNKRATKLLAMAGIKTFASIILGLPSENKESLQATYDHVVDLFGNGLNTLSVCIFTPYVGSRAFRQLLADKKAGSEYCGHDAFDWPLLSQKWIETQCQCSWSDIVAYAKKLSSLSGCLYEDNYSYIERKYDI